MEPIAFSFDHICLPVCNESILWNQHTDPLDSIWEESPVPWKETSSELISSHARLNVSVCMCVLFLFDKYKMYPIEMWILYKVFFFVWTIF